MKVTKREQQAYGEFLGGAIVENKPIGFPQDGGEQAPISNIFYWANAWTTTGGTIPTHPHKWFEIMSFVLEGDIEHFDTKNKQWLPLTEGDVQIIRSGSGISHSEKLNPNSRIFQIWFDPNIMKTKDVEASYTDYKKNDFFEENLNGYSITHYNGEKGIIKMDAPVNIKKLTITASQEISYQVNKDAILAAYLINDKSLKINGENIEKDDFIEVNNGANLEISGEIGAELFIIETSKKLDYKLYHELVKF